MALAASAQQAQTKGAKMNTSFYTVQDVMEKCSIGKSKAYSIIRQINKELEQQGKITIAGRVNKKYFDSKMDI